MSRRGDGPVTVLNVAEKLSVAKSCRWHSCNPADLYQDPVMKHVSEEIDLRNGASFTDSTGDEERSRVISYGPCQFPTLGFIVERYWEIQAHEPEEFWTVNCSHESEDGLATKAENKTSNGF